MQADTASEPTTCKHRYAKFDEATIFCTRCGEQKVMDVPKLSFWWTSNTMPIGIGAVTVTGGTIIDAD